MSKVNLPQWSVQRIDGLRKKWTELRPLLANCEFAEVVTGIHSRSSTLDLSATTLDTLGVDFRDNEQLSDYIFNGTKYRHGGYLEQRSIYSRSDNYGQENRNIHLGIDIWANAGTKIFAPIKGKVHSVADNMGFANYGPTVILKHVVDQFEFFTLYGHLSRKELLNLKRGDIIDQGDEVGRIGTETENGNWPAHLHFQLIIEELSDESDYPGVCSKATLPFYTAACPNPELILKIN